MTPPLRILALPGSLRRQSTNLLLLDTAAALAEPHARIQLFTGLGNIPLFNPDDEAEIPPAVTALRLAIQEADAVVVSAPEYAHGIPGALKNALDWLVSGIELTRKPVALFNASTRSTHAQSALREVLVTMGARFLDEACVTIAMLSEGRSAQQLAADPRIADLLAAALRLLTTALLTAEGVIVGSSRRQPVGPSVPHWQTRPHPHPRNLTGRYCRITPLDPAAHAAPLYKALCSEQDSSRWTYLPMEAPVNPADWRAALERYAATLDPLFFTLFDETATAAGLAAYMRITPEHGSIEIGSIHFSLGLQQSRAATEAQYLLMRNAFDDLGYRRYEWKCDSLNAPSRRAALRLGFRYEGIFRNAVVYKGRSRDTAWYSLTDDEWPAVRTAFELWLAPENFDSTGKQRRSLASLRQQE